MIDPTDEELAFMVAGNSVTPSREHDVKLAERLLSENLPLAVQVVVDIMVNSANERNRLAAAKTVIERSSGRPVTRG